MQKNTTNKIDRENRYSNSKNKSEHQETLENELLKITGGSNNLHCKLQSQSYKILANCVWRMLKFSTKNSFAVWAENVKERKKKEFIMAKLIKKLETKFQILTIYAWNVWFSQSKLNEGKIKLQKRINEYNQLNITRDTIKYRGDEEVQRAMIRKQTSDNDNQLYISKMRNSQKIMNNKQTNKFYINKLKLIFIEWSKIAARHRPDTKIIATNKPQLLKVNSEINEMIEDNQNNK